MFLWITPESRANPLFDGAGVHAFVLAHQQPGVLMRQVAQDALGFVGPELIEIGLLRLQCRGGDCRFEAAAACRSR